MSERANSAFSRSEIHRLLKSVGEQLAAKGESGELFLVGGAAIAVSYDARRVTRDIDAVFAPTQSVRDAVSRVAEDEGLPEDWINDAVKGFLHGEDPEAKHLSDTPGLRISVASPKYLLAMKILSARGEQDAHDIAVLYRQLGYSTAEEGLQLVQASYPGYRLTPRIQYFLEDVVANMSSTPFEPTDQNQTQRYQQQNRGKTTPGSNAGSFAPVAHTPAEFVLDPETSE